MRRGFSQRAIADAVYRLRQAVFGHDPFGENLLMPHIPESVKAYATLGEIIGVLRETWCEYVEQNII